MGPVDSEESLSILGTEWIKNQKQMKPPETIEAVYSIFHICPN
jgi:hypothetical protein